MIPNKDPFYVPVCRYEPPNVQASHFQRHPELTAYFSLFTARRYVLVFISPTQTTQPHSASEDCLLFITPTPRLTTKPIRCGKCTTFMLLPYTAVVSSVFITEALTIPPVMCIKAL
jgi:hypothetical protein